MAELWRDFWMRDTGTRQQVAQLHDRYMMMMMMMMIHFVNMSYKQRHPSVYRELKFL
jgi:hypothetical protein